LTGWGKILTTKVEEELVVIRQEEVVQAPTKIPIPATGKRTPIIIPTQTQNLQINTRRALLITQVLLE
jgi:hypothetical protein